MPGIDTVNDPAFGKNISHRMLSVLIAPDRREEFFGDLAQGYQSSVKRLDKAPQIAGMLDNSSCPLDRCSLAALLALLVKSGVLAKAAAVAKGAAATKTAILAKGAAATKAAATALAV